MVMCAFCLGEADDSNNVFNTWLRNSDRPAEFTKLVLGPHGACNAEFRNRRDTGKCVFCGTNDTVTVDSRCGDCNKYHIVPYLGYPAGGIMS